MKRSGSSIPQFVQRIPADVRPRAIGQKLAVPCGDETIPLTISQKAQTVRFSLRTTEPAEVKIRQATAAAYLETVWNALRNEKPVTLSHRQVTALAGKLYRAWAHGADTERTLAIVHTPDGWVRDDVGSEEEEAYFKATLEHLERVGNSGEPEHLEPTLGPLVNRLLLGEGIARVDTQSRHELLRAFWLALKDGMSVRARNAGGDYTPDPKAERFPEWIKAPPITSPRATPKVTISGLLEGWWTEAKATGRKPSTHDSYANTIAAFIAYLKHDDASRVTRQDVIGFKDFRLASVHPRTGRPISPKTIRDSDLSGLKVIFGWAVANAKFTNNPALGVTVKIGKPTKLRSKGFTEDEARAILVAASKVARGRERPGTFAAKRWVPWLCAYTGARVGEVAQLRKQDLRQHGEDWIITITPEAGTVKTNEAREVVLHPHLVERGFPEFVAAAPDGHLFLRRGENGDVLGPLKGLKNRLQEFVRKTVADPNVAPNHGWRHRFKTVGMEAGIDTRILDAIQGQAPSSVADSYGEVTLRTMAAAIQKIPRIEV